MSDFSTILPNNQEVLERDDKWKKLFKKYENCGDCEEDGYDIRDLVACCEVEDEELEDLFANEEEAIESSDEELKENNKDLVLYNSKPKTLKDLENIYDTDFIKGLKRAFNKRCTELDGMNLTFWKRAKTQEGFNESNIKTPNFEASTRSFFRSSEQVCQSSKKPDNITSPHAFKIPHPVNLNRDQFQFGNFTHNIDQTSNFETSQRFPLQINDIMNGSQKINIRIREMHYDLSVDGRDITEYFIPNCNSTYKNAIPALGNLTINNTISNLDNLQKVEVVRPAFTCDVITAKNEQKDNITEKPDLNKSNVESLNGSVIDNFEAINISNSSREEYTSKGKKTNKLNVHKRKYRKRKQKLKQKEVEPVKNIKEIKPIETVVPISEKIELSYSDVVKLSPKANLKQTKTAKSVNNSKNQVDQQKSKKSSQKKNCVGTDDKNYRNIIDPDTSTEDLPKKQVLSEKPENSLKNQQNNKVKDTKKLKDKPETSEKSSKSKDKVKKTVEIAKNNMSTIDQEQTDKVDKKKIMQKPTKVNKDKIEHPQKATIKSMDARQSKESNTINKENKSEFQYDNSGVPYQNIGGLIVRYEDKNDDSDSSEDDTEFFRRVHAEIRQKKALSNKD